MDRYITLAGDGEATTRERASRFIGIAFHIPDEAAFKDRLALIERAHHSARHLCFAWALGEAGDLTRVSDAGEPSGTAGRPILRRIQQAGLTFIAVVVVRYFGGTLLGKAGLVHAYGEAAHLALEQAPRVQRIVRSTITVRCGYAQAEMIRKDVLASEGEMLDSSFADVCMLTIAVPRDNVAGMMERCRKQGIEATISDILFPPARDQAR
jgi:uncharacterized YigZ family protein